MGIEHRTGWWQAESGTEKGGRRRDSERRQRPSVEEKKRCFCKNKIVKRRRNRIERPKRKGKSDTECKRSESVTWKDYFQVQRHCLAAYCLSLSVLAPWGRNGWFSLVSFTCLSAWQGDHRAPCCGAETVCQPCSSCTWHHPRSGLEHAYVKSMRQRAQLCRIWKFRVRI